MKLKFLPFMLLLLAAGAIVKAQIPGCGTPYNLVTNGDFSSGYTGFTSDLPLDCSCIHTSYCVTTQSTNKCSGWSYFTDHTSGSGNFLVIDGGKTTTPDLWKQSVTICPNTAYTFGFWARNVYDHDFTLYFVVNGNIISASSAIQDGAWNYYSTTWNSGATSGSVTIALVQSTPGNLRDFGIDDIFFGFCNAPLTTTGNTSICKGQTVEIGASGGTSYQWSTGATTASIDVSPATTTTYTVTGTVACVATKTATVTVSMYSNLVSNGEFSSGNTGFTSDLSSNCGCIANSYCVSTQITNKCPGWSPNFMDHTTGSGNFLIIDGSPSTAADVWEQSITVSAGIQYTFSFWARNIYSQEPFGLIFVINGVEKAYTADITYGEWTQYSTTWNSGATSGSIPISIRQQGGHAYRDFGIDDIYFGLCNSDAWKKGSSGDEGSSSIAKDDPMTVYPNPSNGSFTIRLSGTHERSVFVYNVTGKLVFEKRNTAQNNVQVDLNGFSKGIYLLKVLNRDKQEVKRIIVQ